MEVKSEHVRLYSLPGWKLYTIFNNHYFRPGVKTTMVLKHYDSNSWINGKKMLLEICLMLLEICLMLPTDNVLRQPYGQDEIIVTWEQWEWQSGLTAADWRWVFFLILKCFALDLNLRILTIFWTFWQRGARTCSLMENVYQYLLFRGSAAAASTAQTTKFIKNVNQQLHNCRRPNTKCKWAKM